MGVWGISGGFSVVVPSVWVVTMMLMPFGRIRCLTCCSIADGFCHLCAAHFADGGGNNSVVYSSKKKSSSPIESKNMRSKKQNNGGPTPQISAKGEKKIVQFAHVWL